MKPERRSLPGFHLQSRASELTSRRLMSGRTCEVNGNCAALNYRRPNMISLNLTRPSRARLPTVFALGALAFMSAGAQAADDPDEITVSAPNVKTVGRDEVTGAPIEETTQTASVKFDPVTLTTNSGVTLLKDSVLDAANKMCSSINLPMADEDDGTCVRDAVKSAQAQVDAAIARARSTTNG
jgi:UrcA family protein